MRNNLDKILNTVGITSTNSKQLFADKFEILKHPKNQILMTEGKQNNFEYLLIEGIMHRYNISEKGDFVTTGFYMPQSVITPHFVRTKNGKSIFNVQTLTDVVIAEISVTALDDLRYHNKEFRKFGQRILEYELSQILQNEVSYRTCTAKERLLRMRLNYPNLENSIPHHIIASYLGITNVSFSRLRNELSQQ